MNKIILIAILGICIFSCTSKWEYKTLTVKGIKQETMSKFITNKFDLSDETLNLYGKDGWELINIYEKLETVHPNFGNDNYVSGLQPNVRTSEINFVFKRKK